MLNFYLFLIFLIKKFIKEHKEDLYLIIFQLYFVFLFILIIIVV